MRPYGENCQVVSKLEWCLNENDYSTSKYSALQLYGINFAILPLINLREFSKTESDLFNVHQI